MASVWSVAFVGDPAETICAFCLITSAGVRMAHETSSAVEEAAAWRKGSGIRPSGEEVEDGLMDTRADFVRS